MDQLLFISQKTHRFKILIWLILHFAGRNFTSYMDNNKNIVMSKMHCTTSELKNPTETTCARKTKPKTKNPDSVQGWDSLDRKTCSFQTAVYLPLHFAAL